MRPNAAIAKALAAFVGKRVLVAGDLMLDRYWSGEVDRISPEAPVPIVRKVGAFGVPGGAANTATYEQVSSGLTGHAESVEVTFDPRIVSYGQILRIFFSVAHDPTELDRQGPDEGTQYRSAIFYADAAQKRVAAAYIAQLDAARVFGQPIATRVDALKGFYRAESYHQDYLIHHPDQPYIVFNDLPKLRNLKRLFPEWYVEIPVTVASSDMR